MSKRAWTLGDLRRGKFTANTYQLCSVCNGEYSAHPGDYWLGQDDEELTCCNEPVRLVTATQHVDDAEWVQDWDEPTD